jgi:hypothetical protein
LNVKEYDYPEQNRREDGMSIGTRVGQIALMVASTLMLAVSANAEEAGYPSIQRSFPLLDGPALTRAAPQVTSWGTLVALQGGWGVDRMLVFHSAPMVNADPPCGLLTNGYIVNESHPGHNLFNTMLMSALLNRREVTFVILGCFENRPQIVSVSIR